MTGAPLRHFANASSMASKPTQSGLNAPAALAWDSAERERGKTIKIKWVRSAIGYNVAQKRTIKALGLTRLHQVVERPDNPAVRGMVNSVQHLVEVTE